MPKVKAKPRRQIKNRRRIRKALYECLEAACASTDNSELSTSSSDDQVELQTDSLDENAGSGHELQSAPATSQTSDATSGNVVRMQIAAWALAHAIPNDSLNQLMTILEGHKCFADVDVVADVPGSASSKTSAAAHDSHVDRHVDSPDQHQVDESSDDDDDGGIDRADHEPSTVSERPSGGDFYVTSTPSSTSVSALPNLPASRVSTPTDGHRHDINGGCRAEILPHLLKIEAVQDEHTATLNAILQKGAVAAAETTCPARPELEVSTDELLKYLGLPVGSFEQLDKLEDKLKTDAGFKERLTGFFASFGSMPGERGFLHKPLSNALSDLIATGFNLQGIRGKRKFVDLALFEVLKNAVRRKPGFNMTADYKVEDGCRNWMYRARQRYTINTKKQFNQQIEED